MGRHLSHRKLRIFKDFCKKLPPNSFFLDCIWFVAVVLNSNFQELWQSLNIAIDDCGVINKKFSSAPLKKMPAPLAWILQYSRVTLIWPGYIPGDVFSCISPLPALFRKKPFGWLRLAPMRLYILLLINICIIIYYKY